MPAYFDVPLNLPHAGTIALRIRRRIEQRGNPLHPRLLEITIELEDLLRPYRLTGDEPGSEEATRVQEQAATLGRALVETIQQAEVAEDRLGQCVRNLFECLEKGEEGAILSLQAGENPNSLQRPV